MWENIWWYFNLFFGGDSLAFGVYVHTYNTYEDGAERLLRKGGTKQFRRQRITQKKEKNIQNTAKFYNQ